MNIKFKGSVVMKLQPLFEELLLFLKTVLKLVYYKVHKYVMFFILAYIN